MLIEVDCPRCKHRHQIRVRGFIADEPGQSIHAIVLEAPKATLPLPMGAPLMQPDWPNGLKQEAEVVK